MNLSRQSASRSRQRDRKKKKDDKVKAPTLEELLGNRDYIGAITLLEVCPCFCKQKVIILFLYIFLSQYLSNSSQVYVTKTEDTEISTPIDVWLGYCYFHLGDYEKSLHV